MAETTDRVMQAIEAELKTLSEELAGLNLQQNNVLTRVDELTSEIQGLKLKSEKKKQQIEQQTKDKMLIHQKLVDVQRKKTVLEKKLSQTNKPRKVSSDYASSYEAPAPQFKNQDKGGYVPPVLELTEKKSSGIDEELNEQQLLERIRKNFATEDP